MDIRQRSKVENLNRHESKNKRFKVVIVEEKGTRMVITHRKQCWLYVDDIGRLAGVIKRVFTSGGKGVNFHKNNV